MNQDREPVFNVNLPAAPLLMVAAIVGGYALQSVLGDDGLIRAFAFSWRKLEEGRWITLITSLFLHGGWSHALMNAVFVLAFGVPVARYVGGGARGFIAFLVFYLACGVIASLGFGLLHRREDYEMVGASGAGSALMGAAARLIAGRGELGRVFSPPVIAMGAAIVIINLLVAIVGFMPGLGEGQLVAWEAHIVGFAAGVVLAGALPRRREA